MNKKEVSELKRRLKKESASFDRIAGCYVNSSKEKVVTFAESFLNLEDEELHKYLEIANKALSGTVGNNLITLEFPTSEELEGSRQKSLMTLRETALKSDEVLDAFYDHVIENFDYVGNYLIVLFHDCYDVIDRTSDNAKLDESSTVFEYILCAICPVILSKPGLGYREDEHRIGPRIRDWVVGPVDTGFLFPAFNDRATDIHSTLVYTKNAAEPHKEFWEMGLGCASKLTKTEKQQAFSNIIVQAVGPENEQLSEIVLDVQQNLNDYILSEAEKTEKTEDVILEKETVAQIVSDSGINEEKSERIAKNYDEFFNETPAAEELLDTKAIKNNEGRVEKKALQEKVVDLTHKLEDAGVITKDGDDIDIILKVNEKLVDDIQTTYVDGKKCIVIPIDGNEKTSINGKLL